MRAESRSCSGDAAQGGLGWGSPLFPWILGGWEAWIDAILFFLSWLCVLCPAAPVEPGIVPRIVPGIVPRIVDEPTPAPAAGECQPKEDFSEYLFIY